MKIIRTLFVIMTLFLMSFVSFGQTVDQYFQAGMDNFTNKDTGK